MPAESSDSRDTSVDAALRRLDELDTLEVADHVAVYEDIHALLQAALDPPVADS